MALVRTPGFKAAAPRARQRRHHLRWTGRAAADVLLVSLGSTAGLRTADAELADSLRRAGASVAVAACAPPRRRLRTLALTDLALGARGPRVPLAASWPARRPGRSSTRPRPRRCCGRGPGAIRFDAPSAGNRPGRHGLWQRPLERRRLGQAPLLLPWSEGGLHEAPATARRGDRALVLPSRSRAPAPAPASGGARSPASAAPPRDIAAITYAANPVEEGARPRARGLAARPHALRGARDRGGLGRAARAGRVHPARRGGRSRGGHARPCRTIARWCAAPACSHALRAVRTTASRSSRRWPTAACSSPPPRPDRTRRWRSPARSTRAWWATSSRAPCARALDDPLPDYAARAREALAAVLPRGRRPAGGRAATASPARVASAARSTTAC